MSCVKFAKYVPLQSKTFSNFTEDEVRDLYGYLVARAKELP